MFYIPRGTKVLITYLDGKEQILSNNPKEAVTEIETWNAFDIRVYDESRILYNKLNKE